MSKLYFTYSAMNAGKSAILLQAAHNYGERGMEVMLWTSVLHATPPGEAMCQIQSRLRLRAPAHIYADGTDLFAATEARQQAAPLGAVFLDEAQFLTAGQVRDLACVGDDLGLPVLCYGLRTDFRGALFPGSAELLALADHLREVRTICQCGKKSTVVVRMDAGSRTLTDGAQVQIGGNETYTSLCRKHWREATGDVGD